MAVNISKAGRRHGYLKVAYSTDDCGRHVVCYCVCSRQVHVAAADLISGLVNSCGCQPPTSRYWDQYAQLRNQLKREINFGIAKAR